MTTHCDKCDYVASNPFTLPHHIKAVHEKVKQFFCDLCDYACYYNYDLNLRAQFFSWKIIKFCVLFLARYPLSIQHCQWRGMMIIIVSSSIRYHDHWHHTYNTAHHLSNQMRTRSKNNEFGHSSLLSVKQVS